MDIAVRFVELISAIHVISLLSIREVGIEKVIAKFHTRIRPVLGRYDREAIVSCGGCLWKGLTIASGTHLSWRRWRAPRHRTSKIHVRGHLWFKFCFLLIQMLLRLDFVVVSRDYGVCRVDSDDGRLSWMARAHGVVVRWCRGRDEA